MKAINQFIGATGILTVATFALWTPLAAQESGSTTVVVPGQPAPQPPPPVVVQTPPPASPPSSTVIVQPPSPPPAPEPVGVPDSYVWDGHEYVGMVGDIYYYLGPDNVWMPADKEVLKNFHHWEKHHKDWREHAVRNEKYYHRSHHEHDEDDD